MRMLTRNSTPLPFALMFVFAVALALRIYGIADYAANSDEGMFYEMIVASSPLEAWGLSLKHASPPLFPVFANMLSFLTGSSLVTVRITSALAGALTALVVAFIAYRHTNYWVASCVAGLAYALAPGAISMGQLARPYALQHLCLSLLILIYVMNWKKAWPWCAAATTLTHYSAIIPLCLLYAMFELKNWKTDFSSLNQWVPYLKTRLKANYIFLVTVFILAISHIAPSLILGSYGDGRVAWLDPFFITRTSQIFINTWYALAYGYGISTLGIVLGLFFICCSQFRQHKKHREMHSDLLLLLCGTLVIAYLASALKLLPFGGTRHISYIVILVAIALSSTIRNFASLLGLLISIAVGLVLTSGNPSISTIQTPNTSIASEYQVLRTDALQSLSKLTTSTQPKDLIFISVQSFYTLYPYIWADLKHDPSDPPYLSSWKGRFLVTLSLTPIETNKRELILANLEQQLENALKRLPDGLLANPKHGLKLLISHSFQRLEWFDVIIQDLLPANTTTTPLGIFGNIAVFEYSFVDQKVCCLSA